MQELSILCFGARFERGSINNPDLGKKRRSAIRSHVYPYFGSRLSGISAQALQLSDVTDDAELVRSVRYALKTIKDYHVRYHITVRRGYMT